MTEAGRELDALVAEKVMGWYRKDGPPPDGGGDRWLFEPEPGDREFSFEHAEYGTLPHYSTDIAAAWEVAEKFKGIYIYKADINIDPNIKAGQWRNCFHHLLQTCPHKLK